MHAALGTTRASAAGGRLTRGASRSLFANSPNCGKLSERKRSLSLVSRESGVTLGLLAGSGARLTVGGETETCRAMKASSIELMESC